MTERSSRGAARWWAGTTRACWRTRPTRSPSRTSSAAIRTRGSSRRSPASRRTSSTIRTPRDGDFWLDYAADIGDGWNSDVRHRRCHRAARARRSITAARVEQTQAGQRAGVRRRRGLSLPVAQRNTTCAPKRRTSMAFAGRAHPDVFAIPGNHDWYDSLVAFSRTFCRPERGFAGCPTRQTRSYFALQAARRTGGCWPSTCSSAPISTSRRCSTSRRSPRAWTMPRASSSACPSRAGSSKTPIRSHSSYEEHSSTRFLEEKVFKRKARVFLTGDLHFYKRHENAEGIQKITSGGGGAFLHPTHAPGTKLLRNGFVERAAYPDAKTSAAPHVAELPVPVHRIRSPAGCTRSSTPCRRGSRRRASKPPDVIDLPTALAAAMNAAIRDPLNGMWLVAIIGGFIFFTDTHLRSWRILGGAFHALLHLAAAFMVGWIALLLTVQRFRSRATAASLQLLLSGTRHVRARRAGRRLHPRRLSIRLDPRLRPALATRRSRRCASRISSNGCGCGSMRPARSRSTRSASTACRGAGAPRNAAGETTFVADDARASAPRLIDKVELRAEAATASVRDREPEPGRSGRLSRRMFRPSMLTRYSPGPKAPALSEMRR